MTAASPTTSSGASPADQRDPTPVLRLLFAVVSALIIYGSLFPFRFAPPGGGQSLLDLWAEKSGPGDILGNIALFLPFGLIGPFVSRQRPFPMGLLATVLLSGFVLAALCQVAQIYIPVRAPAGLDVVWNMAGILIGLAAVAAPASQRFVDRYAARPVLSVPLILTVLWAASQLAPFVPSVDFEAFKVSLKPLFDDPTIRGRSVLFRAAGWIIVGLCASAALGRHWRPAFLPLGIAAILFLKVIVLFQAVTPNDVVGAAVALALWWPLADWFRRHPEPVVLALAAGYGLGALTPYRFGAATPFEWLPFAGFLGGSMIVNVQSLFLKLFLFGAIFWQLRPARLAARLLVVAAVTVLVAMLEAAQIRLSGHTAEITDIVLAAGIGLAIAGLPVEKRNSAGRPTESEDENSELRQMDGHAGTNGYSPPRRNSVSKSDGQSVRASGPRVPQWPRYARRVAQPSPGGLTMYPFLVNLTAVQARFAEELAGHMKIGPSEAVASMIRSLMPDLADTGEESTARGDFIEYLQQPREHGATYRQMVIVLPEAEMSFVRALAAESRASHSSVVRRLVGEFIEKCEDEEETETEAVQTDD